MVEKPLKENHPENSQERFYEYVNILEFIQSQTICVCTSHFVKLTLQGFLLHCATTSMVDWVHAWSVKLWYLHMKLKLMQWWELPTWEFRLNPDNQWLSVCEETEDHKPEDSGHNGGDLVTWVWLSERSEVPDAFVSVCAHLCDMEVAIVFLRADFVWLISCAVGGSREQQSEVTVCSFLPLSWIQISENLSRTGIRFAAATLEQHHRVLEEKDTRLNPMQKKNPTILFLCSITEAT